MKSNYVKFELEFYYDKDKNYCSKKRCIEVSEEISESFLDDLWDNDFIGENELKVHQR